MPDNERQAEIEAEAQRIGYLLCIQKAHCNACPCTPCVDDARFVLDRARDARSGTTTAEDHEVPLSPFMLRAADRLYAECERAVREGRVDARSPIGDATLDYREIREEGGPPPARDARPGTTTAEDHEAGIEAAARVNHAMYPQQDYEEAHMEAERIIAAYLSRMSPARDAPAGRGEK